MITANSEESSKAYSDNDNWNVHGENGYIVT